MPTLALIGDYSEKVTAHRAIPRALESATAVLASKLSWQWVATRDLSDPVRDLATFDGIWVVPASPYENMTGVLEAIRFARDSKRPFFGTCGGFQHALIEFARNVAGISSADHAETNPTGDTLVVTALACSLVEKTSQLRFTPDSIVAKAYGSETAIEGYRCNYGLSPAYRTILERSGLSFTAFDDAGDIRAAELPTNQHPFFVGTLFQPERAALRNETPPLVRAFVAAIAAGSR